MQILYLLPPALLLWRSFGEGTGALVVLVPVLVMAAGQLAGGLAWLAISGEDAPDLVATAPVPRSHIVRAKIEAVLGGIAIVFAPFVAALALLSPWHALVSALGILRRRGRPPASSSGSARRRSGAISAAARPPRASRPSRRRSRRSRGPATAALAAGGTWFALFPAAIGVGILLAARWMSPHKQS